MNYDEIKKIALYARALCKNDITQNPHEIPARNNRIIKMLMEEYVIDRNLATAIFMNNNDAEELKKICDNYNNSQ